MKNLKNTQLLVSAALLAALTYVATTVFRFPTPTFGYVHIGDGFVLLTGFLLGPVTGGLSAGIGSALSDLLGGYAVWAPGTFVIKFLTALTAALVLRGFTGKDKRHPNPLQTALSGLMGEAVMILGYFLYNIFMLTVINAGVSEVTLYAAAAESLAEIPFNAVQGAFGVVISAILLPALSRIPLIRMLSESSRTGAPSHTVGKKA